MVAIAAGDEVAPQLVRRAGVGVGHPRLVCVPVLEHYLAHLPQDCPRFARSGLHEVLLQFGLPVDQNASAGQSLEVYPVTAVGEGDVKAVMDESVAHHPSANPGLLKQFHGGPPQQPRADAGLHVILRAALQYHRVDPVATQQLREQQPRRPGTDDRHLGRARHDLACREEAARAWRRSPSTSCACTCVGSQSRRTVSPIERVTVPNGCGKATSCPVASSWWIWCSDESMTRSLARSMERDRVMLSSE